MTSDTRSSASNSTAGAAASEAALIATFYGPSGDAQQLHEGLYRWLIPTPEDTSVPDYWEDEGSGRSLHCFDPPAAHDATVVQLLLNAPGSVADAWEKMRGQLEGALSATCLPRPSWWGYTLTYSAVLEPDADADRAMEALRSSFRCLGSSEELYTLERAKVSGGKMWLLQIPTQGDGLAAATVYVALGPRKDEEGLARVFLGRDAELLMPDLVAHKGYHQMRQYRGGDLQNDAEERASQLLQATEELISTDSENPADVSLDELERAYPRSINIVSRLKELHISLLRQSHNYDWWRTRIEENEIVEYHRSHLEAATSEVDLLVQQWQDAMESVKAALSIAQVRVDKVQANRQWWTATLFAVVGFALGLRGLLDREAIGKVLKQVPSLAQSSGNIFVQLGIQTSLFFLFIGLAIVVVFWINRQRLKKDT